MIATTCIALVVIAYLALRQQPFETIRACAEIALLNGIIVAPLMSCAGMVGLFLPAHNPLHGVASILICGAMIWLTAALTYAHYWLEREARRTSDRWRNGQRDV